MTEIEIPGFKATTGTLNENVWHLFKWNVQHREWFRFGYYYPRNDAFSGSFHGDDMKSMQDLRERVKRSVQGSGKPYRGGLLMPPMDGEPAKMYWFNQGENDERSVATVAP